MQLNEFHASPNRLPGPRPELPDDIPNEAEAFIDPLELEAMALILEHSLKVHTTHHFFCWTQGLLQNLIRHEVLICAIRKSESPVFHVDSFSSSGGEPALINNLFNQDGPLVSQLLESWKDDHFQPLLFDIAQEGAAVNSVLARELLRQGASEILAHGTHDTAGRTTSFFIFACRPGSIEPRQRHLLALLAPSLHATWVHTQFTRQTQPGTSSSQLSRTELLTAREQEILGWIYQGKSNIEIGMILGISPLTVKNHVQKILRRLNVLNRAQAVGKALSLRILDGTPQR
ncbi:MAG: transcriptional regulator, LuxR family [Proteobacteria bacterium]|nr:transcriptional regulator, LuxR family [Pseudomonadota bacterium]